MEQARAPTRTSTSFCGKQPGNGRFRTALYPVTKNAGEKFRETGQGPIRRVSNQLPQVVKTALSYDLRFSYPAFIPSRPITGLVEQTETGWFTVR